MRQATLLSNAFGQLLSEKDLNAKEDGTLKDNLGNLFSFKYLENDNVNLNDILESLVLKNELSLIDQDSLNYFIKLFYDDIDLSMKTYGKLISEFVCLKHIYKGSEFINLKNVAFYYDLENNSNAINEIKTLCEYVGYQNIGKGCEFDKISNVIGMGMPMVCKNYNFVVKKDCDYDPDYFVSNRYNYNTTLFSATEDVVVKNKYSITVEQTGVYRIVNITSRIVDRDSSIKYTDISLNINGATKETINIYENFKNVYWLNKNDVISVSYLNDYRSVGITGAAGIELCLFPYKFLYLQKDLEPSTESVKNMEQYTLLMRQDILDVHNLELNDFFTFKNGVVKLKGSVLYRSNTYSCVVDIKVKVNDRVYYTIQGDADFDGEYHTISIDKNINVLKGDTISIELGEDHIRKQETNIVVKIFLYVAVRDKFKF